MYLLLILRQIDVFYLIFFLKITGEKFLFHQLTRSRSVSLELPRPNCAISLTDTILALIAFAQRHCNFCKLIFLLLFFYWNCHNLIELNTPSGQKKNESTLNMLVLNYFLH